MLRSSGPDKDKTIIDLHGIALSSVVVVPVGDERRNVLGLILEEVRLADGVVESRLEQLHLRAVHRRLCDLRIHESLRISLIVVVDGCHEDATEDRHDHEVEEVEEEGGPGGGVRCHDQVD